ncbi:hypothetical protein Tco_0174195 [Tanacetum coccineum]
MYETFYEAWDRFNDLLRGCPHHGDLELHQLDTFYNALNSNDQDSLNSAAGVSSALLPPQSLSDVAELKDMVRALILDKKNQTPAPASVKAVEQSCVTCGGGHSYQNCPATNDYRDNIQEYVSQAAAVNYNQGNASYRPQMVANQIRPPDYHPVFQAPPYQAPAPAHPTPVVQEVLKLLKVASHFYFRGFLSIDSRSHLSLLGGISEVFLLMEEIDEFLERDDSIPPSVDGVYDSEGDTVYLEELLSVINSDPNPPSSPVCEIDVPEKVKSSCEDPPDLELKDLPSHLKYAFLEGDDKLPIIMLKNLKMRINRPDQRFCKSHKHAIRLEDF